MHAIIALWIAQKLLQRCQWQSSALFGNNSKKKKKSLNVHAIASRGMEGRPLWEGDLWEERTSGNLKSYRQLMKGTL